MTKTFYRLVATRPFTANLFYGATHIYLPNVKAGQTLVAGNKALVGKMLSAYELFGYGPFVAVESYTAAVAEGDLPSSLCG